MRLNKILSILPVAALLAVGALPAQAQGEFGIGFSKFGKHSALSVGYTQTFGHPYHRHGGIVVVEPVRRYVPGCWETRCTEVWVPGCTKQVYVDPIYETVVLPCGNVARVLVREGYFKTIRERGHYETRCEKVWVPGHYI